MAGKGDKRRKENYQKFISNYDDIKWSPKLTTEQKQELMNEVYKAFKIKQDTATQRKNKKC